MNLFIRCLVVLGVAYVVTADECIKVVTSPQSLCIINDCTPGNQSTCPVGMCCVHEMLSYTPEDTGPRYGFQVLCKPYRKEGESCHRANSYPRAADMCPCDQSSLVCNAIFTGLFGHCARTHS